MLIPPSSDPNNPCEGVQLLNLVRPPMQPDYVAAQYAIAIIVSSLFLAITPFMYRLRKEPRFYKIRPFGVTLCFNVAMVLYVFATMLPETPVGDFPCELVLFCHLGGISIMCTLLIARPFVFMVESRFTTLLSSEAVMDNNTVAAPNTPNLNNHQHHNSNLGVEERNEDATTVTSDRINIIGSGLGYYQALVVMLKLGYFITGVDSLTVSALVNLRRNYAGVFMTIAMIPLLVFAVSVACMPVYRSGCVNCPIFTEFVIVIMVTALVMNIMIVRFMYLAFQQKQDSQGVLSELRWVMVLAAPCPTAAYIALWLVDPDGVAFNRRFNPQILTVLFACMFIWFLSNLYQVVRSWQFTRERRRVHRSDDNNTSRGALSSNLGQNFTDRFAGDAELKADFFKFAASRYCMEQLNFVEDVKRFKLECVQGKQSERWLRNKAYRLIDTYVREGSPQEVNISGVQRAAVCSFSGSGHVVELNHLFDQAAQEVLDMLGKGVWIDFLNAKHKAQKQQQKRPSKQVQHVADALMPYSSKRSTIGDMASQQQQQDAGGDKIAFSPA